MGHESVFNDTEELSLQARLLLSGHIAMSRLHRFIHEHEVVTAIGIGLMALIIRIVFSFAIFPYISGPLELGSDPDHFGKLVRNWVGGSGFTYYEGAEPTTWRGPGYPLLLAAFYLVFGDLFPVAIIVQSIIGGLICVAMFFIGKSIFGPWIGFVSALMGALYPLLIWYSPRLRYEPLLTLLIALFVLQMMKVMATRSTRDALLAGLIAGCAALVNQIAILLPFVIMLAVILVSRNRRDLAKPMTILPITMMIVIAPWTARNYRVSGLFIPVNSGGIAQFVKGNYEFEHYHEAPLQSVKINRMGVEYIAQLLGADSSDFDMEMFRAIDQSLLPHALSYIASEPWKLPMKILVQAPRFWYLSESPLKSWVLISIQMPLLVLAIVGAIRGFRLKREVLILILVVIYFNLAYASTHVEGRYSTPVVPYVIILAAGGFPAFLNFVRKLRVEMIQSLIRHSNTMT